MLDVIGFFSFRRDRKPQRRATMFHAIREARQVELELGRRPDSRAG